MKGPDISSDIIQSLRSGDHKALCVSAVIQSFFPQLGHFSCINLLTLFYYLPNQGSPTLCRCLLLRSANLLLGGLGGLPSGFSVATSFACLILRSRGTGIHQRRRSGGFCSVLESLACLFLRLGGGRAAPMPEEGSALVEMRGLTRPSRLFGDEFGYSL